MADGVVSSRSRSVSSTDSSAAATRTNIAAPKPQKRKIGRPEVTSLEPYKEHIVRLFSDDDLPIADIARRLNAEHGLNVSERTISRRLTTWNVPRKKVRTPATIELRNRLVHHYNKNLTDEEICTELQAEGFDVKARTIMRLRQKLGMRRRSKYSEYREFSEEEEEDDLPPSGAGDISTLGTTSTTKPRAAKPKKMPAQSPALIPKVTAYVEKYMSNFDGSHDFNHIKRVTGLAHLIYTEIKREGSGTPSDEPEPELDLNVVTLAALLHDVGDKKYLQAGQDPNTLVLATLLSLGAPEELAIKVQRIVLGVSYSSEVRDPGNVTALLLRYPELGVVQDADRLDAIGAVGIGRTFTFGGAKGAKDMGETIAHFGDKLEKLESMMKTRPGKKMARERTERLKIFKGWWEDELHEAEGTLRRK